jgi:acyl-CoA hydrolase
MGEILRFTVTLGRKGSSSVCYRVEVFGEKEAASDDTALFSTQITFVNLDESGGKAPI